VAFKSLLSRTADLKPHLLKANRLSRKKKPSKSLSAQSHTLCLDCKLNNAPSAGRTPSIPCFLQNWLLRRKDVATRPQPVAKKAAQSCGRILGQEKTGLGTPHRVSMRSLQESGKRKDGRHSRPWTHFWAKDILVFVRCTAFACLNSSRQREDDCQSQPRTHFAP